jgi:hypothetical protein
METVYPQFLNMKKINEKDKGDSLISKMPHAWVLADLIRRNGDVERIILIIIGLKRCKYRMISNHTIIIMLIFCY